MVVEDFKIYEEQIFSSSTSFDFFGYSFFQVSIIINECITICAFPFLVEHVSHFSSGTIETYLNAFWIFTLHLLHLYCLSDIFDKGGGLGMAVYDMSRTNGIISIYFGFILNIIKFFQYHIYLACFLPKFSIFLIILGFFILEWPLSIILNYFPLKAFLAGFALSLVPGNSFFDKVLHFKNSPDSQFIILQILFFVDIYITCTVDKDVTMDHIGKFIYGGLVFCLGESLAHHVGFFKSALNVCSVDHLSVVPFTVVLALSRFSAVISSIKRTLYYVVSPQNNHTIFSDLKYCKGPLKIQVIVIVVFFFIVISSSIILNFHDVRIAKFSELYWVKNIIKLDTLLCSIVLFFFSLHYLTSENYDIEYIILSKFRVYILIGSVFLSLSSPLHIYVRIFALALSLLIFIINWNQFINFDDSLVRYRSEEFKNYLSVGELGEKDNF